MAKKAAASRPPSKPVVAKLLTPVQEFIRTESASGVLLIGAAALAFAWANSPWAASYFALLDLPFSLRFGAWSLEKPLLLWVNDLLMAGFFFVIGLEIKREVLVGELAGWRRASLPAAAALGGMLVPALIYVAFNPEEPAIRGWGVPMATDIAFALGVLALLGQRVPLSLKVFLLALAILDDLGAILIIAVFYTADLHWVSLLLAGLGAAVLLALNRRGVTRLAPYLLTGVFIWVCVLKSGVHATLAGVVAAIAIPMSSPSTAKSTGGPTLLEQLEESLHPWVAFAILPLFAFANAGVSLQGLSLAKLLEPVPLGIALGLLVGKPLGIFGATWLAVVSRLAPRPEGASWAQLLGVGMLGGIGFTMSLFIGMLAFTEPAHAAQLRLGVLSGSLLSALAGFLVLRFSAPGRPGLRE